MLSVCPPARRKVAQVGSVPGPALGPHHLRFRVGPGAWPASPRVRNAPCCPRRPRGLRPLPGARSPQPQPRAPSPGVSTRDPAQPRRERPPTSRGAAPAWVPPGPSGAQRDRSWGGRPFRDPRARPAAGTRAPTAGLASEPGKRRPGGSARGEAAPPPAPPRPRPGRPGSARRWLRSASRAPAGSLGAGARPGRGRGAGTEVQGGDRAGTTPQGPGQGCGAGGPSPRAARQASAPQPRARRRPRPAPLVSSAPRPARRPSLAGKPGRQVAGAAERCHLPARHVTRLRPAQPRAPRAMRLPGPSRPAPPPAPHPGARRQVEPPGQLLRLLCAVLVCPGEIAALADFSGKTRPARPRARQVPRFALGPG